MLADGQASGLPGSPRLVTKIGWQVVNMRNTDEVLGILSCSYLQPCDFTLGSPSIARSMRRPSNASNAETNQRHVSDRHALSCSVMRPTEAAFQRFQPGDQPEAEMPQPQALHTKEALPARIQKAEPPNSGLQCSYVVNDRILRWIHFLGSTSGFRLRRRSGYVLGGTP